MDGALVWYSERGGRSLLNFSADLEAQAAAAAALAGLVAGRRIGGILIERIDGVPALEISPHPGLRATAEALASAGFARTPRGLRLR